VLQGIVCNNTRILRKFETVKWFPFAMLLLITSSAKNLLLANPQNESKAASATPASNKKDVVHLTASGSNFKDIFTYFPYPSMPWPISIRQGQWRTAMYRLSVDQQGNVTEIKILKRMGVVGDWPADVTALKTLIRWRAKPGPTRIIDVAWTLYPGYRFITNEGSHIPRR